MGIHGCGGDMMQQKIRSAWSGTLHFYRVEGKWFLGFPLVRKYRANHKVVLIP